MGKHEKLMRKILSGRQDTAVNFLEMVSLMRSLGFACRINGSHHVFYRSDVDEIINLQPKGAEAKPYQVKQVRDIMVKYQLGGGDE